ncbi:MAG: glucosaminidase domain-containing protein [Candidatus Cloacimonetes bacterium]|nr:glucosaminidase domain-containing protein [Candidatus Cloacimonadota bacterium]
MQRKSYIHSRIKKHARRIVPVLTLAFFICGGSSAKDFSLRKHKHVKRFFFEIAPLAIQVGMEHNTPPAVLMAIAGLESGYGKGYVAQITGNVLSLGANKSDTQLPALFLPRKKNTSEIIFDSLLIKSEKPENLEWRQWPKSRKKDYRPEPYSGTSNNLAYFKYNPRERIKAYRRNLLDFTTVWLSYDYKIESFRKAREYIDKKIEDEGKDILLDKSFCLEFVDLISGRKGTFNHYKSWPVKVKYIIDKAGLVELTHDIYYGKKNFETAWNKTVETNYTSIKE